MTDVLTDLSFSSAFGVRLRAERVKLQLTQQEFGAVGGVAANAQGKYESGDRHPKTDYLVAIERLGVDLLYVLTGEIASSRAYSLSAEEREILKNYRKLKNSDRSAISAILSSLPSSLK